MRAIIFDTETSGLNEDIHVILSLSYQVIDITDWKVVKERNFFFPWPSDTKRVSSEAILVNGLTRAFLATQKLSNRKEALTEFLADVKDSDIVVAHNLEFDQRFVVASCLEEGVDYRYDDWSNTFDTMKEMTDYCQIPRVYGRGYKWPKLAELADVLHVDTSDIDFHKSSADVELTTRCFKTIVEDGIFTPDDDRPGLIAKLHLGDSLDDMRVMFYQYGRPIPFEDISASERREIKQDLLCKWAESHDEEMEHIVRRYKLTPLIKSSSDYENELSHLYKPVYTREECTLNPIDKAALETQLKQEAKSKFRSIFFWKNDPARKEYVDTHLEPLYQSLCMDYQNQVSQFEAEQDRLESAFNKKAEAEYNSKLNHLQGIISGNRDILLDELKSVRENHGYKLNLSIQCQLSEDNTVVSLLVLLPKIHELPKLTYTVSSAGTYKIKEFSNKALLENYKDCIIGMSFYLSALCFNIAPCIDCVAVSEVLVWDNEVNSEVLNLSLSRSEIMNVDFVNQTAIEIIKRFNHTFKLPNILLPKREKKS